MERTKGKWEADKSNSLSIVDDSNDRFSNLICQTNGKSREEALANRDFIIIAVNSHDELKSELQRMVDLVEVFLSFDSLKLEGVQKQLKQSKILLKTLQNENEKLQSHV